MLSTQKAMIAEHERGSVVWCKNLVVEFRWEEAITLTVGGSSDSPPKLD